MIKGTEAGTYDMQLKAGDFHNNNKNFTNVEFEIEDGTLVIGVLTQSHLCEKTLSNMQEVKSRGAYLMGVAENGSYYLEDMVDFVVYVPKTDPHFTTTLAIIPLQLMGYYVSVARGLDVDKPRNLAKSVTVE